MQLREAVEPDFSLLCHQARHHISTIYEEMNRNRGNPTVPACDSAEQLMVIAGLLYLMTKA